MIRLILMDLDDTLLRSDKTISDRSMQTLRRCREAGALVGFCTARGEYNCLPFIRQIQPDCVISSGGALARYRGETVYSTVLPEASVAALLRTAERLAPGCRLSADGMDGHYRNAMSPERAAGGWGEIHVIDFSAFCQPVYRICMELPDTEIANQIAASVEDCDCLPFTGGRWYKFSRSGGTKENGVRQLCGALDIPLSEVIAFGDDFSDAGMLRLCGTGVAMGNAIDSVKASADAITVSNDDDGVARYLEEHLLTQF